MQQQQILTLELRNDKSEPTMELITKTQQQGQRILVDRIPLLLYNNPFPRVKKKRLIKPKNFSIFLSTHSRGRFRFRL